MIEKDAWIPLADVARAHGVRGEVRLRLYNKDSDLLLDADEILLRLPDGEEHEVSVDGARRANEAILMKLHSVDDKDRADSLRGAKICLKRGDFPALEDGEFYVCDAAGAEVVHDGAAVGTVKDVAEYPSVSVLVVKAADGGKDWEIPLTDTFVKKIDLENGRIELASMEGLER